MHKRIEFIGIGPQKTGTSWLHEVLGQHPQLCLPKATKELEFFDRYYTADLQQYMAYFSHCRAGQRCGEITPGYFDTAEAPARIAQHFPEARILISLRHPVHRTRSLFLHHLRKGRVSSDFDQAVLQIPRIIDSGKYREHLSRWYAHFPEEHISITLLEDIIQQPETVLQKVLSFLSVDTDYMPEVIHEKVNKAGLPRYAWLARYAARAVDSLKARKLHGLVEFGKALGLKKVYGGAESMPSLSEQQSLKLLSLYEPDICHVEKLLGRTLDGWRRI